MRVFVALLCASLLFPATALADTTGGVRGYVYDVYRDAPPVANARVVVNSAEETREATTDRNGFFVILGLPPGYYTIGVWGDGYSSPYRAICVDAGFVQNVRLVATRVKIMWSYLPWRPYSPHANRTSDVYSLVGDLQSPC